VGSAGVSVGASVAAAGACVASAAGACVADAGAAVPPEQPAKMLRANTSDIAIEKIFFIEYPSKNFSCIASHFSKIKRITEHFNGLYKHFKLRHSLIE
jgi:hypothetical protein